MAPVLPKRQDSIGVTNRIDPEWSPLGNRCRKPNNENSAPILPLRSPIRSPHHITATELLIPKQPITIPKSIPSNTINYDCTPTTSFDTSAPVENNCDVLGDIDSMLQNLTNELDALLVGDINI